MMVVTASRKLSLVQVGESVLKDDESSSYPRHTMRALVLVAVVFMAACAGVCFSVFLVMC